MTAELLNVLVGAALTDQRFCQALLNNPAGTARRFGLAPEEAEVLSGIHARSLSDFAGQLLAWMPKPSGEIRYLRA